MDLGKIKISIIIVYFGERDSIIGLLKSIEKNKQHTAYEIIVVNNKAGDDISAFLKKFKNVIYIESGGDLGYGKGNNLGIKKAHGEYLFIINPDTEVKGTSIDILSSFLDDNKDAAIVAPNLVDQKGKIFKNIGSRTLTPIRGIFALSFLNKVFPNNPISSGYYLKDVSKTKLREADTIPGSAFLIRKQVFDKVGGFDKNFFMYFEELDLCKRIREAGWKIYINPDAVVVHDWEPAEKNPDSKFFKESRFYYFKKHYGIFWAVVIEAFARTSKKNILSLAFITIVLILVKIALE